MKSKILLIFIVGSILLSGCPAENSGGSINFSGDLNATESSFKLDGEVVNSGYADVVHQEVSVYLVTANGTIIESQKIGQLNRSVAVSMTADQIPKYVIINSPDFWEYENIDVSYYEFVQDSQAPEGIYTERSVSDESEFPVTVP